MELSQGLLTGTLPPILANPSNIEKVVRRRTKVERPKKEPMELLFSEPLPIHLQLGREHLDALREEIGAAEDVLANVYEDISLFNKRQSALNEITHFLLRMREDVDLLSIAPAHRNALKEEIDLLRRHIDFIVETTTHRSLPLLSPHLRMVSFPGHGQSGNRADVVFLVDRDERMGRDIKSLMREIHILYHGLKNRGVDLRLGIQAFERASQPAGPMRGELEEFISDLGAIYFNGKTRNALTAVKEALADQDFRDDAHKFLVIFTDNEAHDDYGSAREETVDLARDASATVYAISSYDRLRGIPFPVYDDLTRGTGGKYLNINHSSPEEILSRLAAEIAERMMQRGAPVVHAMDRHVHVGPEQNDTLTVRFPDFRTDSLGLRNLPLETEDDFRAAIERIDHAIEQVVLDRKEKAILHSYLSRIIDFFDGIRVFRLDFHV